MMSEKTVIAQTRHWLDSVVVGLNFCPFAGRELQRQSIYFQVSNETSLEANLHLFIEECLRLDQSTDIETSLLIFANGFEQFEDYLELVELANNLLGKQGYEGIYQVASFHPDYCFEGLTESDAANYTNRSPFPMLHLLREASLARVLEHYPDPAQIPERNISRARQLGLEKMKQMLIEATQLSEIQHD